MYLPIKININRRMEYQKKYEIVLNALKPHFRTQRTLLEQSGGAILSATTAIVAYDSSLNLIPLDILSYPVNLKKMWYETKCPVAIVFREWMDDWIAAFPRDDKLVEWDIICMPGRDHDLYRGKQLLKKRGEEPQHEIPHQVLDLELLKNYL